MPLNRRDVLKAGVFAGAALSLPMHRVVFGQSSLRNRMAAGNLPQPFTREFAAPRVAKPVRKDDIPGTGYSGTDYYSFHMVEEPIAILPGYSTMCLAYQSLVYEDLVNDLPEAIVASVPGPTIIANKGRRAVVRHCNTLPGVHQPLGYEPWTSVHLHGSASLPQFDGYASDVTRPNQFKDYEYPNFQSARTMWYHDHGVHHTAETCYYGLFGQYQLLDPLEQSLEIPHGRYDVPLMLSDALFNTDGSLLFSREDDSGLWGDVNLVNGVPWPVMKVERRKYRFRILAASISRSWKLSLDSGEPMTVIATDGGLVKIPQSVRSFRTSTGERYEVIIDFSKYPMGRRVILKNSSPKNNRTYANTDKIMAFDVVSEPTDQLDRPIPAILNPNDQFMALEPKPGMVTRRFRFHRQNGEWKINGTTWKDVEKSKYKLTLANPQFGAVEIWEFVNDHGGWFHPTHAHLIDFKILDRNGKPPMAHELGPKDVVYLGENETVRVITKFTEGRGKYMMHCHNLFHEDHDMMAQFEVIEPGVSNDDRDPLGTRPRPMSEEEGSPL